VYAGTTEGLYRTLDGGQVWNRLTATDVIINDVYVDPHDSGHVLLATDRSGVLRSEDFAATFHESNVGFSSRQVVAYATDPRHPANVYAGVVNDKEAGGVFQSLDGGVKWRQQSAGLGGRDVYSLASTPAGTMLAGTTHGIYRLDNGLWTDSGGRPKTSVKGRSSQPTTLTRPRKGLGAQPTIDAVVYTIVPDKNDTTFAGTSEGLLRSSNDGVVWAPVSSLEMGEVRFLALENEVLLAAGLKRMAVSVDGGGKWTSVPLPGGLTQIAAVAVDDRRDLWVGGREGVFSSSNEGATWSQVHNLETPQVDGLFFDPAGNRILLTTSLSTMIFSVQIPDHKVSYLDTGWRLRFARPVGDHLLGVTLYDGIVVQPRMVDSSFGTTQARAGK
jgi:ligand-binding sensor domain-containing protein